MILVFLLVLKVGDECCEYSYQQDLAKNSDEAPDKA